MFPSSDCVAAFAAASDLLRGGFVVTWEVFESNFSLAGGVAADFSSKALSVEDDWETLSVCEWLWSSFPPWLDSLLIGSITDCSVRVSCEEDDARLDSLWCFTFLSDFALPLPAGLLSASLFKPLTRSTTVFLEDNSSPPAVILPLLSSEFVLLGLGLFKAPVALRLRWSSNWPWSWGSLAPFLVGSGRQKPFLRSSALLSKHERLECWMGMGAEIFFFDPSDSKLSLRSSLIFLPNARPKDPWRRKKESLIFSF